jgi:hypothetical protein
MHVEPPSGPHLTYSCIAWCCRQQVDKKSVLENLDLLLLVMDEVVDGG